jgi:hypothetical protein
MSFLYLVVMMAASTKYSINSLFSPAPDVVFWSQKIARKSRRGYTRDGYNTLILRSFFEENRPRYFRSSCRRNIEAY